MNPRRIGAHVATALRRLADRIDPPAPPVSPYLYGGSTDLEAADRIVGVIQLRQALRRYSPREEPGQA